MLREKIYTCTSANMHIDMHITLRERERDSTNMYIHYRLQIERETPSCFFLSCLHAKAYTILDPKTSLVMSAQKAFGKWRAFRKYIKKLVSKASLSGRADG